MEPAQTQDTKAKIVEIDNNGAGQSLAQMIFERAGHPLQVYQSPSGLTRELGRLQPGSILPDLNGPLPSGGKTYKPIRTARGKLSPTIVPYSSIQTREPEAPSQECGADGLSSKSRESDPLIYIFQERLAKGESIVSPQPRLPFSIVN